MWNSSLGAGSHNGSGPYCSVDSQTIATPGPKVCCRWYSLCIGHIPLSCLANSRSFLYLRLCRSDTHSRTVPALLSALYSFEALGDTAKGSDCLFLLYQQLDFLSSAAGKKRERNRAVIVPRVGCEIRTILGPVELILCALKESRIPKIGEIAVASDFPENAAFENH